MTLNNRGVTLLELLIAVILVIVVVSSLTYLFPTTSRAIVVNRQRMTAGHLAQVLMDRTKKTPFDLLTPSTESNFTASGTGAGGGKCSCSADILNMPVTTTNIGNVTYTQQVCINLMDQTMQSFCPSDPGMANMSNLSLKHIRVRVSWPAATSVSSTELDSMVAHL